MKQKISLDIEKIVSDLGLSGTEQRTGDGTVERLVHEELGETAPAGRKNWLEHPPRDLIGIALSGGGIRSATFNLGLLQALNELKLLKSFDYLATVSGGGYIGGFWTRWRDRRNGGGEDFPSGIDDGIVPCSVPERREIRHLREFSNFLAPRMGIFSYDTGRLVAAAVSSVIPSLLAALSLLTLALLAWVLAAWALFAGTMRHAVDVVPFGYGLEIRPSALALGGATALTLLLFEARWRKRGEVKTSGGYVVASALALAATAAVWERLTALPMLVEVGVLYRHLPLAYTPLPRDWLYVLAPCAAWGAGVVALVAIRWFTSRRTTQRARLLRAALDRAQSRVLLLMGAWLVLATLWYAGVMLEHWISTRPVQNGTGVAGATALLGALFAKIQQLFGRKPNLTLGGTFRARIAPLLPQILAYLTVGMMMALLVALIAATDQRAGGTALHLQHPLAVLAAVASGITLLGLWLLNPNEVGVHSFYKARLVRAYLGASNPDSAVKPEEARKTEELPTDDIELSRLFRSLDAAHPDARPFHLICCAANDLAPRDPLANLYRGARSATLSRVGCSVGDEWAGWDRYPESRVPTLGAAMTASGAAFNSMMGSKSVKFGPAVTFLMAAFNLRLGLWLPHPTRMHRKLYEKVLVGLPFYKELLGLAWADGRDVHLSDGAHFENLAIYELIRRHCRVILASDCGADPSVSFEDLGNLVRRVREDFGVDIRIDLSALKPGPDGRARQHMVAGDIDYPDGDTGILLLFKPTMVGDEPVDVLQYDTHNPVFPHETTGDQFYDEAQWESYRRLGEHSARQAFSKVIQELDPTLRADQLEIFARARREWMPAPAGFEDRLSRLNDRMADLDQLLHDSGCQTLLREVYKEIPELDGQEVRVFAMTGERGRIAPTLRPEPRADARVPAPEELAPSMQAIRRALLLMAEAYQCEDLARNYTHPVYLGLMNYFARWAYAPLFRMWWPLLKAMYPQPFTRFLEKHYGLSSGGYGVGDPDGLTLVDATSTGFAAHCWKREHADWPRDREVIAYSLRLCYREQYVYTVQAALLFTRREGEALLWNADDLYVPPGLWGTGIGSALLRELASGPAERQAPFSLLVVRTEADPKRGAVGRKRAADQMQLYRSAGFREVYLDDGGRDRSDARSYPIPDEWRSCDRECVHWAVRDVEGARRPAAPPAPVGV